MLQQKNSEKVNPPDLSKGELLDLSKGELWWLSSDSLGADFAKAFAEAAALPHRSEVGYLVRAGLPFIHAQIMERGNPARAQLKRP